MVAARNAASAGNEPPPRAADLVRGFEAVTTPDARLLILGSMPGKPSLRVQEYYGNPRNAFWRIVATVFDFEVAAPYPQRLEALARARVALWDVLATCERPTSLDADIVGASLVVNPLQAFLDDHPRLERILCNGGKAHDLFCKHVAPTLGVAAPEVLRLPSTSPAHAAMSFEAKLASWREALA